MRDIIKSMAEDKKKIMWVEDDQLIGALLAQKFAASGFDLYCAKSGAEAFQSLETLAPAKPDIVIVDIVLPDMDGFQILDRLNQDGRLVDVPRMVLSNLDNEKDQRRAALLGAKKYLVKATTSLDQIVNEVRALI